MKKPLNLLAISLVAYAIIYMACEKINILPEFGSISHVRDTAVVDTVIIDHKNQPSFSRNSDGYYDFVILGTDYKGQSGLNWFLFDTKKAREAIFRWLNTFEPQYKLDTSKIRVWFKNCKGNFSCSGGGFYEGVSCNFNKIKTEVESIEKEFHFTRDKIGVLGNEMGGGGGGNGYFFLGTANHSDCRFDGTMWHELLHEYYFPHIDTVWNKGAGVYTTNAGCEIKNAPILPYYQQLIYNDYSSVTN